MVQLGVIADAERKCDQYLAAKALGSSMNLENANTR